MTSTDKIARRWWVLVLAVIVALGSAGLITAVGGPVATTHTAEALLLVPSGAGADGPGGANEAARLAQHYTVLIEADDSIVAFVAERTGMSAADVRSALAIETVRDSSVLRVGFSAEERSVATGGLGAVIASVTAGEGGQRSIPPESVQQIGGSVETDEGDGGLIAVLVVAVLGALLLGVGAVFALERSDVRADLVDVTSERTGVPGSDLDKMPEHSIEVLVRHWGEMCSSQPPTVALLGVEAGQQATTRSVQARLVAASPEDVDLDIELGGAPGTVEAGEWVAADRELVVLVIPRGCRLRDVETAVGALRQLDLGPTWLLLSQRVRRGSTPRRVQHRTVPPERAVEA